MTLPDDREKILLDTDIGTDIDDALALGYLLSEPRCELLGVTSVTGEPERRAEMVSAICRNVGREDVPIHAGCPEALLIPMKQTRAQQAGALGDWDRQRDFEPNSAVEFMRRTIRSNVGEVTLLAIGPMTNVALLFATDPQIPAMLKRLVLMCGRFFDSTDGVEWNASGDPHATAIVYGAGCRAGPPRHVSFGLDVTLQCTMDADTCRKKFSARVLEPVLDFAEVWFARSDRITFHDPLAAACIFQPDLCTYAEGRVTVSLDAPTMGRTIFDSDSGEKPHAVASEVNAEAFFEHYFAVVK